MKLSEKAQNFLSMNPLHVCTVAGIKFYESPTMGEDSPLLYINKYGKIKRSDFWEAPTFEDLEDYGII